MRLTFRFAKSLELFFFPKRGNLSSTEEISETPADSQPLARAKSTEPPKEKTTLKTTTDESQTGITSMDVSQSVQTSEFKVILNYIILYCVVQKFL